MQTQIQDGQSTGAQERVRRIETTTSRADERIAELERRIQSDAEADVELAVSVYAEALDSVFKAYELIKNIKLYPLDAATQARWDQINKQLNRLDALMYKLSGTSRALLANAAKESPAIRLGTYHETPLVCVERYIQAQLGRIHCCHITGSDPRELLEDAETATADQIVFARNELGSLIKKSISWHPAYMYIISEMSQTDELLIKAAIENPDGLFRKPVMAWVSWINTRWDAGLKTNRTGNIGERARKLGKSGIFRVRTPKARSSSVIEGWGAGLNAAIVSAALTAKR